MALCATIPLKATDFHSVAVRGSYSELTNANPNSNRRNSTNPFTDKSCDLYRAAWLRSYNLRTDYQSPLFEFIVNIVTEGH